LSAGNSQTVSQSYTFAETPTGNPTQGSYSLWEGLNDVIIVAFLQNNSTKEVIQAAFEKVPFLQSIGELPASVDGMALYPNPTAENTTLRMDLNAQDGGAVRILDMQGALVYTQNIGQLSIGTNIIRLNTADLANGLYMISVELENGTATRMLSVTK
jgi:hypothetical protein